MISTISLVEFGLAICFCIAFILFNLVSSESKFSKNEIYDYINMLCDNAENKSITFDNLKFFIEYMKKRM